MFRAVYLITIFLLSSLISLAQVPRTISYQGVITDPSGNPKPDGNYNFTFSLYETSTGGDAIWSETKTLTTRKGLFSTLLGDTSPFGSNVKFDKPYWLGIKVGNEDELVPRIALSSSGYSMMSGTSMDIVNGKVVKSINGLMDNITIRGAGGTTINSNADTINY